MKRIYLFCIIFILVVPFKIFTQGIYFSEPTSSSVYHIPYGGSVGISYNFFHGNGLVVYTYYAKLTYPDGQQSNWQIGEIGGWWVTEGGTYQIQGKAWVESTFGGDPYWAYREPFSFSVIADPPDPNITYNVNFQNNFIGVGNMGNINVSGNSYTSPTNNFSVAQGTTINATAINQTLNYIDYFFSNWSNGSTNVTTTFAPLANTTYTANFIGKPNFANRNLTFVGAPGNPRNPTKVQLSWNEHPNINVEQYKIWRKVKHNGVMGNSYLIVTVNRGTTTYTDEDYAYTSSYTDDLILYDVKAYYTIEGTSSDDNYVTVFGVLDLVPEYNKTKMDALVTVTENSLDNYPNPFNPSTIIRYQIVKAGHVTLKVYDALGREVANLIDKQQPSGKYSVNFNASDLSSGIYLYRITANGFMTVKKMILLR